MHFEILVEDQSGKKMLDILVPKIIGNDHTYKVIAYKGIGKLPKGLKSHADANKRILLDQLPKLLRGYGTTYANYPSNYRATVIVVCDLDDKCKVEFRQELLGVLDLYVDKPNTQFIFAIEEGEAWILGDIDAVRSAFPNAKPLDYINDSICGTWERLADMIYPGGAKKLQKAGYPEEGIAKCTWAEKIAPHMNVDDNNSPSFRYFHDKLIELTNG